MTSTRPPPLHLFDRFGVEIEYMIVRRRGLDVMPAADRVIREVVGSYSCDAELRPIAWSNELVLHVLELKVAEPVPALAGVAAQFQRSVRRVNALLEPMGGRLMPSGAHPWMNPARDARLWPHDYADIYRTFDRIFGCRTHGWTNLQSVHLNLPFADNAEFARLHAAVRLLLPILPALAASTPYLDGRATGSLDGRLDAYRVNARRIPSVSGAVIPEPCFSRRAYRERILNRIYRDMRLADPAGTLRHEWVNARGAIARFERNTIEVRVLDTQECPRADLAIVGATVAVLRALTAERWTSTREQRGWAVAPLRRILDATVRDADEAVIRDGDYLRALGWAGHVPCRAGELWDHLLEAVGPVGLVERATLRAIRREGPLARRLRRAVGKAPSRRRLRAVYGDLCECLAAGRLFAKK
jgi:carboxylate-amine ligase